MARTPERGEALRDLITKWRSDASRLIALSCFTTADHVRQCADELEAALAAAERPTPCDEPREHEQNFLKGRRS